jgi:hypothetical protein
MCWPAAASLSGALGRSCLGLLIRRRDYPLGRGERSIARMNADVLSASTDWPALVM